MQRGVKTIKVLTLAILGLAFFAIPVKASETSGTINSTNKYAWSSNAGWINFGATNGGVAITDDTITGYAWCDLYGWINMAPTNSGVTNDGEGTLSGYAWSEMLGWIDFSSVIINSSGEFTGTASGDNIGTINFDCTNCGVQTDWRPRSARAACNNSTDDDGDGLTDYPNDPGCSSLTDDDETDENVNVSTMMPGGGGVGIQTTGYYVYINNDERETKSLAVELLLGGDKDTTYVLVDESTDFAAPTRFDYSAGAVYVLRSFTFSDGSGLKTVYAKFCNKWDNCSSPVSDDIIYKITTTATTTVEQETEEPSNIIVDIGKKIVDTITEVPEKFTELITKLDILIPDIFKSWQDEETQKLEDVKKYVAQETPASFAGQWSLIPPEPVKLYVFAPLPAEYKALAQKFPDVSKLFSEVGINRLNDLRKLSSVEVDIPGLSSALGLGKSDLEVSQPGLPKGIPVGKLSDDLKEKIPAEVVFTRGANQLVDFNSVLTLLVDGRPQQKINTVAGKRLHLSVKPLYEAKNVTGLIVFKSRKTQVGGFSVPLASLFSSLTFAEPVFAYESGEKVIENELVLDQFVYQDDDGDGIYTADVVAPVPEGEYEIITVIEYQDADYGTRVIRLITVVDPEGYVYEKINGKELRIPGAVVELYWLNPSSKKYETWPASEYQQENKQITDVKGTYSFLVPSGMYYLKVDAPGYQTYEGKPFEVTEGGGVHTNIQLKSKYWWAKAIDWKTALLIVVALLLLYNFYKDRKRGKAKEPQKEQILKKV